MLEPWRSRYLQALGVEIYLPRQSLPGAAPAVEIAWDFSADNLIDTSHPLPTALDFSEPQKTANSKVEIPPIEISASRKSVDEKPIRPAMTAPNAATIRLLIVSAPGILIVDELPSQPKLRSDALRLLGNLLFALGYRDGAVGNEPFEWPMPTMRNAQLVRDENAGRETLAGFFNKKIHENAVRHIFLLGEAAQFWVAQAQREILQSERQLVWNVSQSAQAVLRDAALKRQWWLDLRGAAPTL